MDHGRRGGLNRKRRFRDDDDSFERRKRRHYEEPLHTQLRTQLLRLAESSSHSSEDNVVHIAELVSGTTDDIQLHNTFLEVVPQLVTEQPLKIPFLAAIVELINHKQIDLVRGIITTVCSALAKNLTLGHWRGVKLQLRFIACLQNILSNGGVFPVLDELFARAADLQTASAEDGLGLELVKIILLTTAYAMKAAPVTNHDRAIAILGKTEIVASVPHPLDALVNPFVSVQESGDVQCKSFIGLLQQQLHAEAANQWALKSLPRPVSISEIGEKHMLPSIEVPSVVSTQTFPRLPEVYFSVYEEQDFHSVPPETDIASTLMRDVLIDTMNLLDFNRTTAAKALIDVDCYFAKNTFAKRATPFDRLRDLTANEPTWKPEDVIVDAVFSQLAILPRPEHKMVYYHSLLTEACKIAPAAVAPSLGRAIRYWYRKLDHLDLELAYRFVDWFSHHLSNFGFTWKWMEWIDDLELPMIHPRKAFTLGALDKEIRLSFSQRIRGTLPPEFKQLIPESKDKDIPDYKYNSDDDPYSKQAREILQLIRQKGSDSDVQEQLSAIEKEAVERMSADPLAVSTDVYMTCICFAGAKSLSHVLNCIERCKDRLLTTANANNSVRLQIITSVMEYWRDKPGVGVNIVDKLLNYTILTPMSVIEWSFVTNIRQGEVLTQTYIFEMVAGTIDKVARRIRQVVQGRRQPALTDQQRDALDQALEVENNQFKQLFTVIEDALRSVSSLSNDEMFDAEDEVSLNQKTLASWGRRWLKASTRKLAVEQAWIAEMLAKPSPVAEQARTTVDGSRSMLQAEKDDTEGTHKTSAGDGSVEISISAEDNIV